MVKFILNGKKLKRFPLRLSTFTTLIFIVLEVLARAIREENDIKSIHIGKGS
jgi:hypothetical protein